MRPSGTTRSVICMHLAKPILGHKKTGSHKLTWNPQVNEFQTSPKYHFLDRAPPHHTSPCMHISRLPTMKGLSSTQHVDEALTTACLLHLRAMSGHPTTQGQDENQGNLHTSPHKPRYCINKCWICNLFIFSCWVLDEMRC